MNDLDIINKMSSVQKISNDKVSFETILAEVPTLTYQDAMLYELYIFYNNSVISNEEREKLNNIITTLRHNYNVEMLKNLNYLDRDLKKSV